MQGTLKKFVKRSSVITSSPEELVLLITSICIRKHVCYTGLTQLMANGLLGAAVVVNAFILPRNTHNNSR
jgi:hypothetical protein